MSRQIEKMFGEANDVPIVDRNGAAAIGKHDEKNLQSQMKSRNKKYARKRRSEKSEVDGEGDQTESETVDGGREANHRRNLEPEVGRFEGSRSHTTTPPRQRKRRRMRMMKSS